MDVLFAIVATLFLIQMFFWFSTETLRKIKMISMIAPLWAGVILLLVEPPWLKAVLSGATLAVWLPFISFLYRSALRLSQSFSRNISIVVPKELIPSSDAHRVIKEVMQPSKTIKAAVRPQNYDALPNNFDLKLQLSKLMDTTLQFGVMEMLLKPPSSMMTIEPKSEDPLNLQMEQRNQLSRFNNKIPDHSELESNTLEA